MAVAADVVVALLQRESKHERLIYVNVVCPDPVYTTLVGGTILNLVAAARSEPVVYTPNLISG